MQGTSLPLGKPSAWPADCRGLTFPAVALEALSWNLHETASQHLGERAVGVRVRHCIHLHASPDPHPTLRATCTHWEQGVDWRLSAVHALAGPSEGLLTQASGLVEGHLPRRHKAVSLVIPAEAGISGLVVQNAGLNRQAFLALRARPAGPPAALRRCAPPQPANKRRTGRLWPGTGHAVVERHRRGRTRCCGRRSAGGLQVYPSDWPPLAATMPPPATSIHCEGRA